MTVVPSKADFHSPSQFAAEFAESNINAHGHWQFIRGTATVRSTPPDDHPAWLGKDTAREVADLLPPYPPEAISTAVNSVKNDGVKRVMAVE